MRVLIADDEPLIRELLAAALEGEGNQILPASSGPDLIALARSELPDVVVLDLRMPGMDGHEVLRRLKSSGRTAGIPVVVLSALGTQENVRQAKAAGAADFLVKSDIQLGFLRERIEKACRHSENRVPNPHQRENQKAHEMPHECVRRDNAEQTPEGLQTPIIHGVSPEAGHRVNAGPNRDLPRQEHRRLTPRQIEARLEQEIEPKAMPFVAAELVDLSSGMRASSAQLAETIARDQALTVRVLKVANSAFYSHLGRAQNLTQAILHIGVAGVRDIALAVKMIEKYSGDEDSDGLNRLALWLHSIACAALARDLVVVSDEDFELSEEAFLAGLLHDVGKAVLDDLFHESYSDVIRLAAEECAPLHQEELRILGLSHVNVAQRLLPRWRFPKSMIDPIVLHHTPAAQLKSQIHPKRLKLIGNVNLANILAKAARIGSSGDETLEAVSRDLLVACEVDYESVRRVLADLDHRVRDLSLILLLHDPEALTRAESYQPTPTPKRCAWLIRETSVDIDPLEILVHRSGYETHCFQDTMDIHSQSHPDVIIVSEGSPYWMVETVKRLEGVAPSRGSGEPRFIILTSTSAREDLAVALPSRDRITFCRSYSIRDIQMALQIDSDRDNCNTQLLR